MQQKFIRILLYVLLLFPSITWAKKWTPETLPMVHLQDARRYVCNPDGVLSPDAVANTDRLLQALERDKGVESVVVVVKQLEGDDPYGFGMALGKKYGIGSKTQRTGLILVLATEDRSYQILTGNGLEGTLPDAICRRIQNRVMVPRLKQGDWDGAIVESVKAIDGIVRGDTSLLPEEEEDGKLAFGSIISIVVGVMVVFVVLYLDANRKCPKCKKRKLIVVKKERVRLPEGRVWKIRVKRRCARCGYEETSIEEDARDNVRNGTGGMIIGGGFRGGSSFGGGSFGGGSFGGGGSGGRF